MTLKQLQKRADNGACSVTFSTLDGGTTQVTVHVGGTAITGTGETAKDAVASCASVLDEIVPEPVEEPAAVVEEPAAVVEEPQVVEPGC